MSGHVEPLLDGSQDYRGGSSSKADADASIFFYYIEVAAVLTYAVLAFVLPVLVPAMAEAAHISTMHVIVFIVVAFFLGLSARHVYGAEAQKLPPFYPLSPLLAQQCLFATTLGNATLLLILGAESWLRRELGTGFSVLLLVQVLAAVEGAAALIGAVAVSFKLVQYVKVSALSGDDDDVGGGAGRWSVADEGGRQQRSRTRSFFRQSDSAAGAAGGAPQAPGQAAAAALAEAQEQLRALRAREEQLGARVAELSAALASQLEAGGESVSAAALRCANEHNLQLQAEQSRLTARVAEGDERRAHYEAELQRAANDVGRYREQLKVEKRRNDKLAHSLEEEKEANAHAQATISELQDLLSRGGGRGGARDAAGDEAAAEASAHEAAYAAARPASAAALTSPGMPRTASIAVPSRGSFGGALDSGGPGSGGRFVGAGLASPTAYGSLGAGSSRRLRALARAGSQAGGLVGGLVTPRAPSLQEPPAAAHAHAASAETPDAALVMPMKTPRRSNGPRQSQHDAFDLPDHAADADF